jgi:hypothetical protein
MTLQRAVRVPYVEVGLGGKRPDERTGVTWALWPFDVLVSLHLGGACRARCRAASPNSNQRAFARPNRSRAGR